MKKTLFASVFSGLVAVAAVFYTCQKEPVAVGANTGREPVAAAERSGACASITVVHGAGLVLCGVDGATNPCSFCGEYSGFNLVIAATPRYTVLPVPTDFPCTIH